MAETLNTTSQAQANQEFWSQIQKLPEDAQRSFWDAGSTLSLYIGENPSPRRLEIDTGSPPADWPLWKKLIFYMGQSQYNQAVVQVQAGQAMVEGAGWLWGALQGDFNKSPTMGQVVTGGLVSMIPGVDQVCDVRDIVANCITLSDEKAREDPENWAALGLTCLGFVPLFGSAVKTVGKAAMKGAGRLLDLLKQMEWLERNRELLKIAIPWGRAPIDWLRRFDWQAAARQAAEKARAAFLSAQEKAKEAVARTFGLLEAKLRQLVDLLGTVADRVGGELLRLGQRIKARIDVLLSGAKAEAGKFDASPGAPNRHDQRDRTPPEDQKPRAKLAGVQTAPNTAFFWSGHSNGIGGESIAQEVASSRGGTTLEMLMKERGIKMPDYDRNNPVSVKAWHDISEAYAQGVSGEVRAVVGKEVRAESAWLTRELPALRRNPAVTRITIIDPETLAEKIILQR